MYPEEFIYLPLYNNYDLTSDWIPVLQPLCKNLIIADVIKENGDFRKREDITLSTRIIKDYELNTLINPIQGSLSKLRGRAGGG